MNLWYRLARLLAAVFLLGVVGLGLAASFPSQTSLAAGTPGNLFTWGWNVAGQLGDGSTTNRNTPQLVNAIIPSAIDAGYSYSPATAASPNLIINDVSLAEGNAGTIVFTFTVSLSSPSSLPVTFDIATQNGTATAASGDYTAKSLTAQSIPAGSSSYTFTVLVNGDTTYEQDEFFGVQVLNITGAIAIKTTGTGTIINDDPMPTLSITDASANEGNAGLTAFNFTVSLSNASWQSLAVDYATSDGTATTADNDYLAATGTLIIAGGQTTGTITVYVNGDTKFEPNETFTLTLSNPRGATLGTTSSKGTIINDDSGGGSCDPLIVTSNRDDGSCGTLRAALSFASTNLTKTVNVQLAAGSVISLTTGLTLTTGVAITTTAPCSSAAGNTMLPPITIQGVGTSSSNGLTLAGHNSLYGLWVRGFSGVQIKAPPGSTTKMLCVRASKL